MKRWQKAVIWAVVVGFAAGGIGLFTFQRFSPPPRGSTEEVVLIVEGRKFTRAQFSQALQNVLAYYRQLYQLFGMDFDALLRGSDGAFRSFQYQREAAEALIRQVIIQNEADRLRIRVPAAELDQAVKDRYDQIVQQVGGEEILKLYLEGQNLTLDEYKKLLRQSEEARLREEKLKAAVVGAVEPTDADLEAYLSANQSAYQTEPEKIKVAHILVKDAKLADELLAKVQEPDADFAALAREYSEDADTKEKGGETDFFSRYESPFSTTVTDVIWALNPGEVRLVEDDQGYHIVKLLERKPPVVPPLSEIRDKVREDYVRDETNRRWESWYKEKREKVKLEVKDPVILASLLYPTDKEAALAKLLAAQEEGYSLDIYLPYYIGRIYEDLYTEVGEKRLSLEQKEERTPAEEAELQSLKTKEAELKEKALAQYLKFMETGEGDEAFYNRVLLLDPKNVQVLYQLAESYRVAGINVQAEAQYSKLLEIDPNFLAGWVSRGDNAMAMEIYGRAAEYYQKALELAPGNLSIRLKLAEAYVRDKRYSEAKPILEEILKTDAENTTALILMGDVLMGEGNAAEAVNFYQRAWQKSPAADAELKLAQALAAAGRTEEALRRYQNILQRSPYSAQAQLGYGDLLLAQGQKDKALEAYQNALRFAGDVATREQAARKIIELKPDDIATRFRLAGYLREQYKYDGAIAQYEAILEMDPQNIEAVIGLGDCYVPKTQYDEALEYYRKALEMATSPEKKVEIYGKIVTCEEQRVGTGKPLTEVGLEALWNRALLYKELGRYSEAISDLKRIQNTDPNFRAQEVADLLAELEKPQPQ
ncbi:tetratricopeptide repeat protein [Candidatus Bipolaricaulota bacterium]|nr:tetratricopeptide repeat protein [Candidatus Bipolaricaulota bacterium]